MNHLIIDSSSQSGMADGSTAILVHWSNPPLTEKKKEEHER
jgi:hypothetical protein